MNAGITGLYICLASCITLLILTSGCTQSQIFSEKTTIPAGDPEIGIVYWMDAMNRQDLISLYRLSPSYVRSDLSLEQFEAINRENPYFSRNMTFTSYEVTNKTISGNSADIKATVIMRQPPKGNEGEKYIPIWFHFTLALENGEWKVWTVP